MQRLTENYKENLAFLKLRLAPEDSFDVICREILIGKDKAALFYIDGFTKDGVMQKLMQHFMGLKSLPDAQTFASANLPYVEVDVISEIEPLITAVLSGASVMIGEGFGASAVVIDSRTFPQGKPRSPIATG